MLGPKLLKKTGAYTALFGECILVDATAGAVTITLPTAAVGYAPISVKKTDGSANAVTVQRAGAATIDGATTYVLSAQYDSVQVIADGANWSVIGRRVAQLEAIGVALGDETTAVTAGVAKVTMRMPYAMKLTTVRSNLNAASSAGLPTVDINEGGASILSTKLSIDVGELTSVTAAAPPVLSDTALADDAEITFDVDVAGTGAKGLKVWLIGYRA